VILPRSSTVTRRRLARSSTAAPRGRRAGRREDRPAHAIPDRAPIDLLGRFLADASAERCLRTYQRIAPFYDALDATYERRWKQRLRARLLRRARGRVLDVGIGTGCDLPH
jgi:hypothetical protein